MKADRPPAGLLLEPDAPEAGALQLVVESLDGIAGGSEAKGVAVTGHRHLLVEELRLLLPQRESLLGIGLPRELSAEGHDLLVGGPAGPGRRQVNVVGGVEEVPHPRREDVVLLGLHAALAK